MSFLKSKAGIVVALLVLSGVGYFMHQATTKENKQTITIKEGGVANIHNEVGQEENNWSVGGYIEKETHSKGVIVGVTIGYSF